MRGGRPVVLATACLAICIQVVTVWFAPSTAHRWNELAHLLVIAAYAALAVLIAWHRPGHPISNLSAAIAVSWAAGEALVSASYAALVADETRAGAALASVWGGLLRGLPWFVAVLVLPLVFPDGRMAGSRLSRAAAWAAGAAIALFSVAALLSPTLTDTRVGRIPNPMGLRGQASVLVDAAAMLFALVAVVALALAVGVLVRRYRREGALARQQTLIFALAFVAPVVALVAMLPGPAEPWVFSVATLPVPVAIGIAVLQRRLYDLPLAANRALAYAALLGVIVVLYALVVGGVGATLHQQGARWLPWVAAGVVAVCFAPIREALERAANRITYGSWAQPAEVLQRAQGRLAAARDLPALLDSVAEDLASDLGLGWVEIVDEGGQRLAGAGTRTPESDEVPLTAYGTQVGRLRWQASTLRQADTALLAELAGRMGSAIQADRLLSELRAAQERLVVSREEEKRRLHRDLHDGLGPTLAGLQYRVETVRHAIGGDPRTDEALLVLRASIHEAVGEVRRIVEGLRPPELDALGLVEALRQQRVGADRPVVRVAPADLPALPAAAEIAAYRIAQEAVTNAVRHAGADSVAISFDVDGDILAVTVEDDGRGVLVPRSGGVGLKSMRERAEEIGGTLTVDATAGQGTRISAVLPIGGPS